MLYEQQAEVLSKLKAFVPRNGTAYNKHDAVLYEISKHRERQAENINFRNKILERQKRANYINEYDRLAGVLGSGLVKSAPAIKHINERMGHLKDLASESIHGRKHNIFEPKKEEEKRTQRKLLKSTKREKATGEALGYTIQ